MDKHGIILKISEKSGLSIADSMMVVQAMIYTIIETVLKGEQVKIDGFGVFEERTWAARYGHNPATGESIYIGERKRAVFIADERLIKAIQPQRSVCNGQLREMRTDR